MSNLHRWQKFYTAAGSDGIDKFHLCPVDLKDIDIEISSHCLTKGNNDFDILASDFQSMWIFKKH